MVLNFHKHKAHTGVQLTKCKLIIFVSGLDFLSSLSKVIQWLSINVKYTTSGLYTQ